MLIILVEYMKSLHHCSSFFRTQLPQAVGVAYSLKMDKKDSCVVAYLGDGSSSEVYRMLVIYKCYANDIYLLMKV